MSLLAAGSTSNALADRMLQTIVASCPGAGKASSSGRRREKTVVSDKNRTRVPGQSRAALAARAVGHKAPVLLIPRQYRAVVFRPRVKSRRER
jgi:hypothetical protein